MICQRGFNFDNVFFFFFFFFFGGGVVLFSVMRGFKYHYKRAIIGPPAKRQLDELSLACRCWPNIER